MLNVVKIVVVSMTLLLTKFSWQMQEQVLHMTKKYHIYMTLDGRISMAGLSGSSCKYLAEAMKDAVENVKA